MIGSRFKVGFWWLGEDRDRAFDGSSTAENALQERTRIRLPLLTVDLRLTPQTGIQAAVSFPDVTRSAVVPRPSGTVNFEEAFRGLGDTSVLGWYRLRPIKRWNVLVSYGTSIPTGKTERPRFRAELEEGSFVPISRLQRGSGTFDPLFGASVNRKLRRLTMFASLAARTPLYENDEGLRTGSATELNGGVARELGTHRVSGYARLGWLHREQDAFHGTPVLVGGGDWVYVTPGVAVLLGKGVQVQAEVKRPIYRALANKQLDSSTVVQFGISRAF